MPARVVALAGIDTERALQLEIAERAPARIGRQIVGVEGNERIDRILIGAAEPAVVNDQRSSADFQVTSQDLKFLKSLRIRLDDEK